MKNKSILIAALLVLLGFFKANAQINFGERALGALQKGAAGLIFSDADAAALSKAAVDKMDYEHIIAGPKDPYTKNFIEPYSVGILRSSNNVFIVHFIYCCFR